MKCRFFVFVTYYRSIYDRRNIYRYRSGTEKKIKQLFRHDRKTIPTVTSKIKSRGVLLFNATTQFYQGFSNYIICTSFSWAMFSSENIFNFITEKSTENNEILIKTEKLKITFNLLFVNNSNCKSNNFMIWVLMKSKHSYQIVNVTITDR